MLTLTDVGALTAKLNKTYQPVGSGCSPLTDKAHMLLLVSQLEVYTEQVHKEAADSGLTEDQNLAQWGLDMARWQTRLNAMRRTLDATVPLVGKKSCEAIYDDVVGPLLDGDHRRAKVTDGIVNPAVVTYPDMATPYILGNGVVEYNKFQAERFEALIGYMLEEAKILYRKAKRGLGKWTKPFLPAFALLAVAAGGYMLLTERKTR